MIRAGIDLGCDHIRLCIQNEGLVFDEPCMVALDQKGNALAIGNEAKEMKGMTDDQVRVVSPLAGSTIDFEALHVLLEQLCYEFRIIRMFKKTTLLFSYPTRLSSEQCELLKQHLLEFGASRVYFDEEIWIAAIGAELDLFLPVASCVLNIGSSNCDIAIFSSGKMQTKADYSVSGYHINQLIKKWIRQTHGLMISENMAEQMKQTIGQTIHQASPKGMNVQGLDVQTQGMKVVNVNENQMVEVLLPLVNQWIHWIQTFIQSLSQEQKEDILLRGIVCCGGTFLLKGLLENFQKALPCPVYVTDDPLNTVEKGLEILLSRMD